MSTTPHTATVLPFRARSKAERRLCRDCLWCGGALADQCEAPLVTELKFLTRMPAEAARRDPLICGPSGESWQSKHNEVTPCR